jgi:hypothetical protein
MTKPSTSIRMSELTRRQITELIANTGTSQSEVIGTAIDRMYQQEIIMNNQYTVGASNDQGASTTVANGETFNSIPAAQKAARSELGKGWTAHVYQLLYTDDGEMVGKNEVSTFRIR